MRHRGRSAFSRVSQARGVRDSPLPPPLQPHWTLATPQQVKLFPGSRPRTRRALCSQHPFSCWRVHLLFILTAWSPVTSSGGLSRPPYMSTCPLLFAALLHFLAPTMICDFKHGFTCLPSPSLDCILPENLDYASSVNQLRTTHSPGTQQVTDFTSRRPGPVLGGLQKNLHVSIQASAPSRVASSYPAEYVQYCVYLC